MAGSGNRLFDLATRSPIGSLSIAVALAVSLASVALVPIYETYAVKNESASSEGGTGLTPESLSRDTEHPIAGAKRGVNEPDGSRVFACARGQNGGTTDIGVTEGKISLAANHVKSGPGASFLGSSWIGIQAVIHKVNRTGGICGRLLDLKLVDDGWDGPRGKTNIEDFIAEGRFALPVVPSSEGLTLAIESGVIRDAMIPVVGTDGMLIQQYQEPFVWPVAVATVSQMRIMAHFAYEQKGAKTFGIVYDKFYRFGKEGAEAFGEFVLGLPDASLKASVGIDPLAPSYKTQAEQFNRGCGQSGCDMIAMLLEPGAAERWVAARPQIPKKLLSGAQPLFNRRFATNCGSYCDGMLVWSGYNPPLGRFANLAGMKEFEADVKSIVPTADTSNAFLEGSYLGMSVFVEALKIVGPNLTRQRLRDVLNEANFSKIAGDFTFELSWSPTRRHANVFAQAFSIVVAQGGFAGFAEAGTGFLADPRLRG